MNKQIVTIGERKNAVWASDIYKREIVGRICIKCKKAVIGKICIKCKNDILYTYIQ